MSRPKNEGKKVRKGEGRRRLTCGIFLFLSSLLAAAPTKDQPVDTGPNVVILRELENIYEAVPFEHRSHAKMAEMWNGCVTCHHRSPQPEADAAPPAPGRATQEASVKVPACKSCHPATTADTGIHMPSLKGAYHRQCLNCHQEWMHENACVICHKPKQGLPVGKPDPAPDDIVGRMHPPIPEPQDKIYKTRFTPADGGNVLFRHKEHTATFGIKCVDCHHRDNCAHCHGPTGDTTVQKPLRPGSTWTESHGPCMGCHQNNRCRHCHYKDGQTPPKPFDHWATRQGLNEDHAKLACGQCHPNWRLTSEPACGDAACHQDKKIDYPTQRPGPIVTMRPSTSRWAGSSTLPATSRGVAE